MKLLGEKSNRVNLAEQQEALLKYPPDVVEILWSFGNSMISESQQRAAQIDSKLGVYLTYGTAIIALLGISAVATKLSAIAVWLVSVSVICSAGAVVCAMAGLRSETWAAPSEVDWFKKDYLHDADKLRRYHITALLKSHQLQQERSSMKALMMFIAEWLIGAAAFSAAIVLCLRIISSL